MHPSYEMRAKEVFTGTCSTVSVTIEESKLQGLHNTGFLKHYGFTPTLTFKKD